MWKAVVVTFAVACCVHAATDGPCDDGYTYYPDIDGTEDTSMEKFSGSCIRLYVRSETFFPTATKYKNFGVAARDFCGIAKSGGRLLSFSSLSTSPNGIMNKLKTILAPATSQLVLVGGVQNPQAVGLPKHQNWIWTDADTPYGIINVDPSSPASNWGPDQPEYVFPGVWRGLCCERQVV